MKFDVGETTVVVGKRVTLGAAAFSTATVLSAIFPPHAAAIMGSVGVVTFLLQLIIAHYASITHK